jgi:hypothetical protein
MKCSTERLAKFKRARQMAVKHGFRDFNMPRKVSKFKDPELKAKWVAALRSGNYIQGSGRLKRKRWSAGNEPVTQFCCLGVLCDIVKPDGWKDNISNYPYHTFNEGKSTQEEYPNLNTMKEFGIYTSAVKKLASLNDDDKLDFNKIADYIEKNL